MGTTSSCPCGGGSLVERQGTAAGTEVATRLPR